MVYNYFSFSEKFHNKTTGKHGLFTERSGRSSSNQTWYLLAFLLLPKGCSTCSSLFSGFDFWMIPIHSAALESSGLFWPLSFSAFPDGSSFSHSNAYPQFISPVFWSLHCPSSLACQFCLRSPQASPERVGGRKNPALPGCLVSPTLLPNERVQCG